MTDLEDVPSDVKIEHPYRVSLLLFLASAQLETVKVLPERVCCLSPSSLSIRLPADARHTVRVCRLLRAAVN